MQFVNDSFVGHICMFAEKRLTLFDDIRRFYRYIFSGFLNKNAVLASRFFFLNQFGTILVKWKRWTREKFKK